MYLKALHHIEHDCVRRAPDDPAFEVEAAAGNALIACGAARLATEEEVAALEPEPPLRQTATASGEAPAEQAEPAAAAAPAARAPKAPKAPK